MKKPVDTRTAYVHKKALFSSWFRVPASVLFIVLLFQPVSPAFADEIGNPGGDSSDGVTNEVQLAPDEETESIEAPPEEGMETVPEEPVEESALPEEPLPFETIPNPVEDEVTPPSPVVLLPDEGSENPVPPPIDAELPPTPEPISGDTTDPLPLPGEDVPVDDIPTSTPPLLSEEEPLPVDIIPEPSVPPPDVSFDDPETTTVSTTPSLPVTVEQPFVATVTNEANKYSFQEGECTRMRDETYYCAKVQSTSTPTRGVPDGVSALPDSDGDKEIFVTKGADMVQLTDNTFEDDAPNYDAESDTVVWHRLIDGRYQIMSYSIQDEEEVQLTSDRFNNMEPARYGEVMVWQGWVGNDWEIMMLDGGEVSMLTDNIYPDISPRVNKDYILWQSFEGNTWKLKVLSRADGTLETIDGGDGASIDNPRFVLVYDAKTDNGDIETRGFDLEEKVVVPLSAVPQELPENIPDPEQTGEDRALIQQLVQKPKTESETDSDTDSDTDVIPDPDLDADEHDIVVPSLVSTSTSGVDLVVQEEAIPPVVVTPYEPPTLDLDIEDVIVPPYTEITETATP